MGMEIQVNSLEEMCDLMCGNYIPEEDAEDETWIFTFGSGQEHAGHYVTFTGSFNEARSKMCEKFGIHWGFQYSEEAWERIKNDPNRLWEMETPLEE